MDGKYGTALRELSAIGAELDESELAGVTGGRAPVQAVTTCEASHTVDDLYT